MRGTDRVWRTKLTCLARLYDPVTSVRGAIVCLLNELDTFSEQLGVLSLLK